MMNRILLTQLNGELKRQVAHATPGCRRLYIATLDGSRLSNPLFVRACNLLAVTFALGLTLAVAHAAA